MKKHFFTLIYILFFGTINSNAAVWRLNNSNGVSANFTGTLQDAINSVSPGDTIYIEPSPYNYGGAIISKKVILIGAGYWLNENDSTQANKEKSEVEELVFNSGSEGSEIMGLYCYKLIPTIESWKLIAVNTDNISIRRNYFYGKNTNCYQSSCSGIVIELNGNRANVNIEQNWLECYHTGGPAGGIQIGAAIHINGAPTNISIRNNFIKSNANAILDTISTVTTELTVGNNVIWGNLLTYNVLYVNNVLISGTYYDGSGNSSANNICNGIQFPDINNNQLNINMTTVFVDYDLYIDKGYILAPGSPAIGAGFNGGDCGVFSNDFGGNPYVLSGMPNIPAIFDIDFNSTVFPAQFENLEINIKAKSHN